MPVPSYRTPSAGARVGEFAGPGLRGSTSGGARAAVNGLGGVFPCATRFAIIHEWIASHTSGRRACNAMSDETGASARSRAGRIVAITAALSTVGAIVGAITSVVALGLSLLLHRVGFPGFFSLELGVAAAFGAAVGAVLAPLEAWLLLRRVPLWRAITETAIGTIIGAVALSFVPYGAIGGAMAGFTAAAIRLRIVTRPSRAALTNSPRAGKRQLEGDDTDRAGG